MEHFSQSLQAEIGLKFAIIPINSRLALLSLFAGEADIAMLSADLQNEVDLLRQSDPGPLLRGFALSK
jgi:hypothetical protein